MFRAMDAVIVGAGIAGLTAAYHLKRKGFKILLLEKSGRWGGCLHTVRCDDALLEKGPNSFLSGQETIREHIAALGLEKEVVEASPCARQRFVLHGGKLIPLPKRPSEFLQTPLMTLRGKCRLFLEPLIRSQAATEETVAQFVTRRLGRQALRLVEPMINGIYAGDAAALSLPAIAPRIAEWEKKYGSLFKALKRARLFSAGQTLYSFRGGMQALADALYEKVKEDCRLNTTLASIKRRNGVWQINNEAEAPVLILAVPAREAASLVTEADPLLSGLLNAIPYAPLAVIHLLIDRWQIGHPLDGFGFLSGTGEENFLLGSLWSSSIFENRCEDSKILLTCYAGGAKNPAHARLPETEIGDRALDFLRRIFQTRFRPEEVWVTRIPQALPQYTLGHRRRLDEIQKHLDILPGLFLAGNYQNGISVNDTMADVMQVMLKRGFICDSSSGCA